MKLYQDCEGCQNWRRADDLLRRGPKINRRVREPWDRLNKVILISSRGHDGHANRRANSQTTQIIRAIREQFYDPSTTQLNRPASRDQIDDQNDQRQD
jgi:hypothetical protein